MATKCINAHAWVPGFSRIWQWQVWYGIHWGLYLLLLWGIAGEADVGDTNNNLIPKYIPNFGRILWQTYRCELGISLGYIHIRIVGKNCFGVVAP